MTDTIIIRLLAESRDHLEAGVRHLRAAGLDVEWRPFAVKDQAVQVDGELRLYDTPETVEAKAKAAGSVVRSLLDRLQNP